MAETGPDTARKLMISYRVELVGQDPVSSMLSPTALFRREKNSVFPGSNVKSSLNHRLYSPWLSDVPRPTPVAREAGPALTPSPESCTGFPNPYASDMMCFQRSWDH